MTYRIDLKETLGPGGILITDPRVTWAVAEVRKEGWTGTRGIQDGFKEKFNGKLNASKHGGWTSVTFTSEPDYQNFMVLAALFM